jgi:integrase
MYGRYYTKNRVKDGIVNHESGEEYDFVFTEKWGIFAKPSSMERICRSQGFKFHSLRHLHASSLIESGISPKTVQERLGHSNIQTTLQTYTHPTEKMQREAVEVFDKKMRAK